MRLMSSQKCLNVIMAMILTLVFGIFTANADEVTETLTFAWDAPSAEELSIITEWKMSWGVEAGGPYAELGVIAKGDATIGTDISSPLDAVVTGQPGTHETRHFVLVACGNVTLEDGSTEYQCSDFSNEISHAFWIPFGGFQVPVNFRIITQ